MLLFVVFLLTVTEWVNGCGSFGGNDDSRIYTNPSLQWQMSPPAAWTYPVSYAQQTGSFFPDQPLTLNDAANKAQGDMQAAVLSALSKSNIPTNNVRVTSGYTPQQISDCIKIASGGTNIPQATEANTPFGYEEQGAITRIAMSTAQVTVQNCAERAFTGVTYKENIIMGSMQIEGITVSGYQLRLIVAELQSVLNFNNKVRFQSEIKYS
ncbi:unnamed protein product [Bursaphelenchus okinawaensis]|uniref:Uncharacterized protein n=1 Tax=Bursaphelenchus okinawaensis TaxID=465554 RepID=A0A811L9J7_9BILA|nr:unnamed protein product [Bursaphelenchus okinawaensis]CAG9120396.1 unnamed protein product [Bursaphelenchus okinawaensis]